MFMAEEEENETSQIIDNQNQVVTKSFDELVNQINTYKTVLEAAGCEVPDFLEDTLDSIRLRKQQWLNKK
jgi:hypothetical protein